MIKAALLLAVPVLAFPLTLQDDVQDDRKAVTRAVQDYVEAFYQALALSKAPMIASHSSLRKFTPGFERNMSDEMLIALAEKGGVLQINFGSSFLNRTIYMKS